MCDYSLHNVKSRPAKVGDKLTTHQFYSGTRGFCAPEDNNVAVCVLPGTELSFNDDARRIHVWPWTANVIRHKTSGRSTNSILCIITTRWNFRTGKSCYYIS
jgi:hypothetical protein